MLFFYLNSAHVPNATGDGARLVFCSIKRKIIFILYYFYFKGIIAGGFSSVSKAKEGAEDSIIDGMDAIKEKFVCDKDVVVGKVN